VRTLFSAITGVLLFGCTHKSPTVARVPLESLTGFAAAAIDDSGMFASPVLPRTVTPVIPPADAESAAVAMGYWGAPSYQDRTVSYYHVIPTERRHFCGRAYYVLPVVEMPDTTVVRSNILNDWMMWAPTWVMPICDDKGIVRTSVMLIDVPPGMRVIQGSGPHDVPELVPDSGTFPHITHSPYKQKTNPERGLGMTPETAVAVVARLLGNTGARTADVPEAFEMVRLLDPQPPLAEWRRIFGDEAICPRWRVTLDRPVKLRGATSGRVVRTTTVYVTRSSSGCRGEPVLQIPTAAQPVTVPFLYYISAPLGKHFLGPRAPEVRWTTLRVLQPIWFEQARLDTLPHR